MKVILLILIGILLVNCSSGQSNFSQEEIDILNSIGFEVNIFKGLKSSTQCKIVQYETSDRGYLVENGELKKTGLEKQNGFSFDYPNKDVYTLILEQSNKLKKHGFLIFQSEIGYNEKESVVTVIESKDQFDILRIVKTDGVNFDIMNEDIIKKFKEWDSKYGIEIYGADYAQVDIWIKNPKDIESLSKEIYEFCPDIIDQGLGDIIVLEKMIREGYIINFWWD